MNLPRCVVLALALLAVGTRVAMAGETQIVLQWLHKPEGRVNVEEIHKIENALEAVSGGKYLVDGHDVGGGVVNVFLYSEDSKVDAAIVSVVRFFERGGLPKGMRIGRAVYQNKQRTDWHFQPAYPPGLASFDLDGPPPK